VLTTLLEKDNLSDAIISENDQCQKKYGVRSLSHRSTYQSVKKARAFCNFISTRIGVGERNGIGSLQTQVITGLLNSKLNNELITMALDLCKAINSDHYKTIVLTTMFEKKQELTDDGFKKLVSEGSQTESDHYAMQILTTALQLPNLSSARVLAVLNVVSNINPIIM